MTVTEYWASSFDDCLAFIQGYEGRKIDNWKNTRSLEYAIYCVVTDPAKRENIYNYHPLPDDPSPAEIKEAATLKKKQEARRYKQRMEELVKSGRVKPIKKANGG